MTAETTALDGVERSEASCRSSPRLPLAGGPGVRHTSQRGSPCHRAVPLARERARCGGPSAVLPQGTGHRIGAHDSTQCLPTRDRAAHVAVLLATACAEQPQTSSPHASVSASPTTSVTPTPTGEAAQRADIIANPSATDIKQCHVQPTTRGPAGWRCGGDHVLRRYRSFRSGRHRVFEGHTTGGWTDRDARLQRPGASTHGVRLWLRGGHTADRCAPCSH